MRLDATEHAALNAAMDRYAEGDDGAFGRVYDLLAPRLLGFFMRQTRDDVLSQDLTQQTLLQMHAARRNYSTGSDVLPWAFAIARNVLIDARRRTRKEFLALAADEDGDWSDLRVDRASCPDGIAISRQMAEAVNHELSQLPEGQRAAYDLVRREGLSVAQTAEALGTTPTAVKLRVHRVYEALRAVLA
jgi:RNA polymerase sigma-70 factor, ECF subfamily